MTIRYNVKSATDALNELAETLDSLSNLPPDSGVFENRERDLVNAIDLRPDMGRIRATFERAIKVAHRARDAETEAALREQLSELQTTHEELTRGEKTEREYKTQLADVAASVRGLLADIAEDGTKKTAHTQPPPARVTAELVPEQAALLEKAAVNSQATVDEMAQWRKWLAQLKKPGNHRKAPKLAAAKQQAVVVVWNQYATNCRAEHKRPSLRGCLDDHGADVIYTKKTTGESFQLIELVPNEATLKAIVHNAQAKQSARKKTEKSKSRQKRKHK